MSTPSSPNGLFTLPAIASAVDADLWGAELNTNFNTADSGYTTRTLDLNFADYLAQRPVLKDYGELISSPASAANVLTLDVTNGNHFAVTLTEHVTTLTISNPTATGKICPIELWVKQNGTGGWAITWPAAIVWAAGLAPIVTTTANHTDIFVLQTKDGGSTYAGSIVGQDYTGL